MLVGASTARRSPFPIKAQNTNIQDLELKPAEQETLATLEFKYTKKELSSYLAWRTAGLTYKSSIWLAKAAEVFWRHTRGKISKNSLERMREALFSKYEDSYSHGKVLNFTKGFLRYLAKLTFYQRYLAFDLFLEKPKVRKVRKKMTARIITKDDVEHVLSVINQER